VRLIGIDLCQAAFSKRGLSRLQPLNTPAKAGPAIGQASAIQVAAARLYSQPLVWLAAFQLTDSRLQHYRAVCWQQFEHLLTYAVLPTVVEAHLHSVKSHITGISIEGAIQLAGFIFMRRGFLSLASSL
jgi:hypothetical protein